MNSLRQRLDHLLRGRLRTAVAAALAGLLIGATVTAWQTDAFASDDSFCWGALDQSDVTALFHTPKNVKSAELPVVNSDLSTGNLNGSCRLSRRTWQVTATAHQLSSQYGGASGLWADEFLSARLTPLGGGLSGMASDTRAWLALPEDCTGDIDAYEGPDVVDLAMGSANPGHKVDPEDRAAMARAVVKLVNRVIADQGCRGTVADPSGHLPAVPAYLDEKPGDLCGIKGLALTSNQRKDTDLGRALVAGGTGPVRTCEFTSPSGRPRLRLMTVTDPHLAGIYYNTLLYGGTRIENTMGSGIVRPDLAAFRADCQTGRTLFLVQTEDSRQAATVKALLPRYAAAEATRIGCGPPRITVPR
ncbi:hypothetical protein [Streptomyces sp. NBC_01465]|uniref:hypothetical protein n=1 Tax=Streptomyces sp. NBC_01465 TaxID=2903878 RepID=UPI002E37167C|nr:hypothetical protein [Streptomyces sp. NBC_01465]